MRDDGQDVPSNVTRLDCARRARDLAGGVPVRTLLSVSGKPLVQMKAASRSSGCEERIGDN